MTFAIQPDPVPLTVDGENVVRIGATRVTLDTVIGAHLRGTSPQEIARQYPTLALADVYAVVGYYLRHTALIDSYLEERRQSAECIRREMEDRFDPIGIRQRLEARRASGRSE